MKLDAYTKSTLAFLVILSLSISIIHFENAKAQTISSTDPKKLLKEFKTVKFCTRQGIALYFLQYQLVSFNN